MIGYDGQAHDATAAAARRSYGRLVALLSARTRNVAGAEDALSEAFAAALAEWPRSGTPRNPEAWLLAVARRRSIDAARHRRTAAEAGGHLQLLAEEMAAMAEESAPIPDERLSLMFACAHPAIEASIRSPLILQTILGFDAATIASAFLAAPATMGAEARPRQSQDQARRHSVSHAPTRGHGGAARRRPRRDLRGLRRGLE
jgi:RNA polymerase sigma-70 factor (ECF subfamily)